MKKYFRILIGFLFGVFIAIIENVKGIFPVQHINIRSDAKPGFYSDDFDYDSVFVTIAVVGIATLVGVVWHIQHNKNN